MDRFKWIAVILTVMLAIVGLEFSGHSGPGGGGGGGGGPQMTGAIFTTDRGCQTVNENIYPSRRAVFLNGGPRRPGAAGLPKGEYYVVVTQPNGQILGKSLGTTVYVNSEGEFENCEPLWRLVKSASSNYGVMGYDTTGNPGGEYKAWVCSDADFSPQNCKTDNFKVAADEDDESNDEGRTLRTEQAPSDGYKNTDTEMRIRTEQFISQ